ncbi:MAG: F0F1 ATP synthase subunit epsilon [Oscillospiraceae bacterium]|nr:F0F1 ATP synthase subunit epsilon [Oscillospiraceae bacterium]
MSTFNLTVSTPTGNVFSSDVACVSMRGTEGDFAIMAGHIPFTTSVKPGECKITMEDGTEKKAALEGGLLCVSPENVTLLSGSFNWI